MSKKTPTDNSRSSKKPKCGIIMPISATDGLSEAHWIEVNNILSDAIETAGFEPNLVSSTEEVGIIQKTIIQNLYDNPVVVCDVSGKNPNVMFELGMRLAFDKPTIIIKDDMTSYSFDTSPIEHLNYPRDLRFSRIVDFKTKLSEKIKHTHNKAVNDTNYTTFLKNFGEFKVAKIDQTEVSGQEFIIEELKSLKGEINKLEQLTRRYRFSEGPKKIYQIKLRDDISKDKVKQVLSLVLMQYPSSQAHLENDRLRFIFPEGLSDSESKSFESLLLPLTDIEKVRTLRIGKDLSSE